MDIERPVGSDVESSTPGNSPAAIQWRLGYSMGVASLSVVPGPALTAANKTITWRTDSAGQICVAAGENTATIAME
jgi:hypothetical protein